MKKVLAVILTLVMALTTVLCFSSTAAAEPVVTQDNGAYVRLLGNPAKGTVKFQYGWEEGTLASAEAVGYWLGIYDVTNSHYEWAFDTEQFAAPVPELFLNAHPTQLPPGDYCINFFVRDSYGYPVTNVAIVQAYFTVLPKK
jgi:hypothetical protein